MKIRISCDFIMDTVMELPPEEQEEMRTSEIMIGPKRTLELDKEEYLDFLHDNSADLEAILDLKFEEIT